MTFLLDTSILLWALAEPDRLDDARRQLVEDRSNTVYVSSVNAAEIAIKVSIGKLTLDGELLSLADEAGFDWIDFTPGEAMLLRSLPFHHRDPFDRMLVCQSLFRGIPLMTDDTNIAPYGCNVV
ncbi:MAG: type II toxin-antitoxin system VapC family toxin [Spirochaetaceae bacterium]|nr:MAG: type II toxin-antitoxin system VapC family toxin [Spirochaetaceae bacterium]